MTARSMRIIKKQDIFGTLTTKYRIIPSDLASHEMVKNQRIEQKQYKSKFIHQS